MMQQQHVIDTIKAKYPWVDIIFGTHNIHQFPELVDNALNEKDVYKRQPTALESEMSTDSPQPLLQNLAMESR